MRILVNGWFWGNETNGSGQYLHYLLEHLPRLFPTEENQITVVAPQAQTAAKEPEHRDNVTLCPVQPPSLPRQLAKVWWEQITMPRLAKKEKADLLWVPYWAAPCWQPVPTVVTIHDIIPLLLPAYRGGRLQRLYTSLVSFSARRSSAIITVSEASKRDVIQHLGVDEAKVTTILSGPNRSTDRLASDGPASNSPASDNDEHVRRKYALPDRYFLYLGGFDVRKNVKSVIKGYKEFLESGGDPSIELVVAGQLPKSASSFFPDPQMVARSSGVDKRTHFCGFVDEADKVALYRLALGYVFPSLYEGFGMTIIEAMDAGTPTITSRVT